MRRIKRKILGRGCGEKKNVEETATRFAKEEGIRLTDSRRVRKTLRE